MDSLSSTVTSEARRITCVSQRSEELKFQSGRVNPKVFVVLTTRCADVVANVRRKAYRLLNREDAVSAELDGVDPVV